MRAIIITCLIVFLSACNASTTNKQPMTAYEKLSAKEQYIVDSILDEFKRHHLFFLPELGDLQNLIAATARAEDEKEVSNKNDRHSHDHSLTGNSNYKDEHLDIKITAAYPDANGTYHTPTITLTPTKMYTYETLYTVSIKDKAGSIEVTATKVEKNNPERIQAQPDKDFVKGLAIRLKGELTKAGIISLQ